MIKIMHICNMGAGFPVGKAMSWYLLRKGALMYISERNLNQDTPAVAKRDRSRLASNQ